MINSTQKGISSLLKKIACSTSASACSSLLYQPKEPKCLKK